MIGLWRRPFAAIERRLEAAQHRIDAIPALLRAARPAAHGAPEAWLERAESECDGLLAMLGDGLARFLAQHGVEARPLRVAARRVSRRSPNSSSTSGAVAVAPRGDTPVGRKPSRCCCGKGTSSRSTRGDRAVRRGPAGRERGGARGGEPRSRGEHTWLEALGSLSDRHPTVEGHYVRYGRLWADCRRLAEERRLLTWPDCPIRYVPRPLWARRAAPHLYFLPYHSPAPLDARRSSSS